MTLTRRTVIGGTLMAAACARRTDDAPPAHAPNLELAGDVKGREIHSESVYADAISPDGDLGFICRIARYPSINVSWAWVHAFQGGKTLAFTSQEMPCSEQQTHLDETDVAYTATRGDTRLRLTRTGPRDAPEVCRISGSVGAHRSAHAEHGVGATPIRLDATFRPAHAPVSSLSGRTEVLGSMSGTVEMDGVSHLVDWQGHFHEQVRSTPRWMAPFCYATLRGPGYHSVAIKLEQGAVGFVVRSEKADSVNAFDIEPPSQQPSARRFALTLAGGDRIEGVYRDTYVYSVPIYDVRRRGSVVVGEADNVAVSGCVNDYLPERLSYLT